MLEHWSELEMRTRLVRYADLKPCLNAFIDTRTPGSEAKENFTVIGPGVSENPDQHVHITVPHGFNIGGARQPPHCVNSQHSHETAEVFVVHSGTWRFTLGHDAKDAAIVLEPGDIISIPTGVFRGFENVGHDTGYLFAVLGGDDPGHVLWAPKVFELAKNYGLVLLESGRLIDTVKGETVPPGARIMQPTTMADVARLQRLDDAALARCVVRAEAMGDAPAGGVTGNGIVENLLIGEANPAEGFATPALAWPHGFSVRRLRFAPGAASDRHRRAEEEVLFVHAGALTFTWDEGELTLGPGDTITVPIGLARRFRAGDAETIVYAVRRGDRPAPAVAA